MVTENDLLRHRVLLIDDNPSIHADYRKILASEGSAPVSAAEAALFGTPQADLARPVFDVDSAMQGRDGVERAREALAEGRPYSVAFVDMRMPPGWDGLETIENLWKIDPDVQVVICSAYADYDWLELVARLGHSDKLIVVKKPFEPIEILQCASALSRKWQNARALKAHVESLEMVVTDRTRGLEAANRQLRHLASHDALTGLPNRLLLDDRIAQAIAQAQRQLQEFAVMVVDLDRFKLINDSLGHRAGDELLRVAAQRLTQAVRNIDTAARLGAWLLGRARGGACAGAARARRRARAGASRPGAAVCSDRERVGGRPDGPARSARLLVRRVLPRAAHRLPHARGGAGPARAGRARPCG